MHDAFLPICLLRDYPYALECLACHDNFLLVGTKQGLLLIYEVTPKSLNHATYFVPPITTRMVSRKAIPLNLKANGDEILRLDESAESPRAETYAPPPAFSNRVHTTRTLGKKPILQLAAIPELDMLLALAEGKMNVYQLQNYQLITMVPNSRGATVFAHCLSDVQHTLGLYHPSCGVVVPTVATRSGASKRFVDEGGLTNPTEKLPALRICVTVKRRLLLWRWNPALQEFLTPGGSDDQISAACLPELSLPEEIRSLMFIDANSVLVGMRAEYLVVSLISGETRCVTSPGKNQLPLLCRMPGCFRTPETELHLGQLLPTHAIATSSPDSRRPSAGRSFVSGANATQSVQGSDDPAPIGLGRDDLLQVASVTCSLDTFRQQIRWTGAPHQFYVYPPYIIGAMDKFLEVRVAETCELVQQLPIARVQALCHYHGWLYAATAPAATPSSQSDIRSSNSSPDVLRSPSGSESINSFSHKSMGSGNEIWLILSANRMNLVEHLIRRQEFELAQRLAEVAAWTGQNPIETRMIAILHACHLYQQLAFPEALRIFTQQLVDPSHVLSLFPNLIPEKVRSRIYHPPGLELLDSEKCASACEPLITFLLTWRRVLRQALSLNRVHRPSASSIRTQFTDPSKDVSIQCHPIFETSPCISSAQNLLELIDTGLLKCYLATNSARVGPLLRQANSCQLEESEKTLFANHRYQDLVMLYQSHGIHRKALSVLQQLGSVRLKNRGITPPDESMASAHSTDLPYVDPKTVDPNELEHLGHPRTTVRYLKSLGPSHFDLVVDYGDWVMQWYPVTWMRIFADWERQLFLARREIITGQTDTPHGAQSFSRTYRGQVINHLEKNALHLIIPFLELLIFGRPDQDIDSEDDDVEEEQTDEENSSERWDHRVSPESVKINTCACENDRSTVRNSLWPLPSCRSVSVHSSPEHVTIMDPDCLPPIFSFTDHDPVELHTIYAAALIARLRSVQPIGRVFANRVCEEQPKTGTIARLRRRLLRFLQHPDAAYSSVKLLTKCPYDGLFEERALLLANLKNHEQALTLWVHVLNDWDQAVSHCVSVYEHATKILNAQNGAVSIGPEKCSGSTIAPFQNLLPTPTLTSLVSHSPARDSLDGHGQEASRPATGTDLITSVEQDIFFLLVLICMEPPDPASLGILIGEKKASEVEASDGDAEPNMEFRPKPDRALEVLRRFGDRVDASKVVRILPSARLSDVMHYLKSTFFYQETLLTQLIFLRNAAQTEMTASRTDLVRTTSIQFLVMPGARCRTCRRRIGTSAFVRHPTTGELEHYGCCREFAAKT